MNQRKSMSLVATLRVAATFPIVLCCANSVFATSAPTDIVGEVTTLIGAGSVKSDAAQELVALQQGTLVRAGDLIETAAGGHVHIRFIDGGLVSVRPMSRLHIESYRNAGSWGPASIKFKLEAGVMRSVTGKWGELSRDRFRLNTPIAAIGIKGTDFIVKADNNSTYATVMSGAIVMASLEGDCAVSLGPCSGGKSTTLSADMRGKMIEFIQQPGAAPRLVPTIDLQARAEHPTTTSEKRYPTSTLATPNTAEAIGSSETTAAAFIAKETPPPNQGKSLIWLHNVLGWNVPENSISQRFDTATADGRKAVTGNFFITLYRDDSIPFMPTGSQASFKLTNASATLTEYSGQPAQAVQISNSSLNVDFAQSTFNTRMTLESPTLGQDTFAASGKISSNGLLSSNNANQNLYGALSNDGSQAGYGFNKTAANGKVSGITLWGR